MKKSSALSVILVVVMAVMTLAVTACAEMFRSDSANALHQNSRARQHALDAAKAASSQAPVTRPVSGDVLASLLSGNTHVSEFRRRGADAKPYFTTYKYYSPDGVYIVRDTYSRRTVEYQAVGYWRVSGGVLCTAESVDDRNEVCFTVRFGADKAIEFWTHKPGNAFHDLVSSRVTIVRPGLQTPDYVTTSSPYQQ